MGKKAGWKISTVLPSDGIADGGTPYTDEEMNLMEQQDKRKQEVQRIKDEIIQVVNEFDKNLLSKEGFEARLKQLIEKMQKTKGIETDPNAP